MAGDFSVCVNPAVGWPVLQQWIKCINSVCQLHKMQPSVLWCSALDSELTAYTLC
jgi:hypothetical protein